MRYCYKVEKNKNYTITSVQFPSLKGVGKSEDQALDKFISTVFTHIKECFHSDIPIPEECSIKGKAVRRFGLPLNMTLKIKLHNAKLSQNVSRTELAQFLSFTYEDVPDGDWSIETLRKIKTLNLPKYKNVQRLFDISHESTVREIEQAFRVLGFNVDITPYKRNI